LERFAVLLVVSSVALSRGATLLEENGAAVEDPQPEAEEPIVEGTMSLKRGQNQFQARYFVLPGEDGASGAWRFSEEFRFNDVAELLKVTATLTAMLDEKGYEAPEEITKCGKRKCSVGKLKGRAEEARKAEMYDEMGADLLRALSKPIDQEQVTTRLHRDLERAFDGIGRQRQREEEERLEQEKVDRRRAEGEAAMEESRLRKLKDEEDWAAFEVGGDAVAADPTAEAGAEAAVLAAVTLTMTQTKADGEKTETPVTAELREGQDAAHAAYDLCESVGLHNADEVVKITGLLKGKAGDSYTAPPSSATATTEKLFALARKETKAANFAAAGAAWSTALHGGADGDAAMTAEMKAEAEAAVVEAMKMQKKVAAFEVVYMSHKWEAALESVQTIPNQQRNATVLLMAARIFSKLGKHNAALTAAAQVVTRTATYSSWTRGSPRMIAATLAANTAMEIGSSKQALKIYSTVLKYDPDQKQIRDQYRGLKKVVKLLKQSDEQMEKGFNKKGMDIIDECLSAVRGLDVDSPMFRSVIQLKLCKVQSRLRRHEEALENCDAAIKQRSSQAEQAGLFTDPRLLSEAHLIRADALMNDMDYDEAVQDFKASLEGVQGEQANEIQMKLREANQKRDEWNGGEKNHRYNERTGFPEGKPPQRDNIKILDLPVNLDDSSQDVRCKWLKKQYKKKILKWHPDKYKGNKDRGARKMRVVNDAKEALAKQWDCRIRGGRGRDRH